MTIDANVLIAQPPAPIGRRARRTGRRRHLLVATAAGITVGLTMGLGSVVGAAPITPATTSPKTTPTSIPSSAPTPSATERQVTAAEQLTRTRPADGKAWTALGLAYVRRAYETADPAYYPLAATALDRAKAVLADAPEVLSARAGLALARHQFATARTLAVDALAAKPNSFDARLALVDATVELGRYDEAAGLVDQLIDQHTGVASLSRLSYLRQLQGDLIGAESAMRAAVASAPAGSVDRAVALAYLGDILLERGRGAAAQRAYDDALAINPLSSVAAMGIARLQAASADWTGAARTLDRLTERVPLPGALGERADLARARHDAAGARSADQLVDASISLFRANGAVVDAELAILLADRGPSASSAAVAAAKQAYRERRTIFTEDAMGWSLLQAGRPAEALPYARRAVATEPAVASVRWHAASVFAAAGDAAAARRELTAALRNPWFSAAQRPSVVALAHQLGVPQP